MPNVTEWRSAGRDSSYPFYDDNSMTSNRGWKIPSDLFCDAQICSGTHRSLWISSVIMDDSGISMLFSISSSDGIFGTFTAKPGQYKCAITGNYGEYRGTVIVSPQAEIPVIKQKEIFSQSAAVFQSSVIYQLPSRCVESISIGSSQIYNRIYLVEGSGIKLVKLNDSSIRIDAIGEYQEPLAICYPQGVPLKSLTVNVIPSPGRPIASTHTILPTIYGNVNILPKPLGAPNSDSSPRQILEIINDPPAKIEFSLSR